MLAHPPQGEESALRLPGGGLNIQESLAECAIREVFEETGIHMRNSGIAFLRDGLCPSTVSSRTVRNRAALDSRYISTDIRSTKN